MMINKYMRKPNFKFLSNKRLVKQLKILILLILIVFFGLGVFASPDILQSDRDNAVIISSKALMNFENPYNYKTEIGQKITTGLTSAIISIPFVYLFGNIQLLSFLFYGIFLVLAYRSQYFYVIVFVLLLLSPFIYRVMYYRLDELYWAVFYMAGLLYFKSKYKYLLFIPLIFSRNIFNFDFRVLLYNIDYWLLIFILYTLFLYKIYLAKKFVTQETKKDMSPNK